VSECRTSYNETTERTGANGCLPDSGYNIHCPAIPGPEYKMNYFSSSCAIRLEAKSPCKEITCKRHDKHNPAGLPNKVVKEEEKRHKTNQKHKCVCCGEIGIFKGRGLIRKCYDRHKRGKTLDNFSKTR
jgi:hypothetical protein